MPFWNKLGNYFNKAKNWLVDKGLSNTVGQIIKNLSNTVGSAAQTAFPVLAAVRPYYDQAVDYGINYLNTRTPKQKNKMNRQEITNIEPKPRVLLKQENENELGMQNEE